MRLKKFALRGMIGLAVAIALCILFAGTVRSLTTPKVRFAAAKMGKFESVTELTGEVVFPETEEITVAVPEGISASVTRVFVSPGERVKKGQKLISAKVNDAEKTLASLQQEYDTQQKALESWSRKNGEIRLSRNEQQWKDAYEATREAESAERQARLSLLVLLGTGTMPESLPEDAGEEASAAWDRWQESKKTLSDARSRLSALDRFAIAEDVWTLLQQREETERKRDEAEAQMMTILLLGRQLETVTAPHAGYIAAVSVEKGGALSGDTVILTLMPEDAAPVIRTDVSDVKQSLQKGATVSIQSEYWGRVETKVTGMGLSSTGHPYADAEITQDVIYALGEVSEMMKEKIGLRLTTRAQEATCLIPASAVRGSGESRYVYIGETESSAFAGTKMIVRKQDVTVLAESADTVSIAEDLSRSKVLYMEDRALSEGGTVMQYEE